METVAEQDLKPALLTKSEIQWLLGKKQVSKSFEYKIRSTIKNKLQTLKELELPLLARGGFITETEDLTKVTLYQAELSRRSFQSTEHPYNNPYEGLTAISYMHQRIRELFSNIVRTLKVD